MNHYIVFIIPIIALIIGFYSLTEALWSLHREGNKNEYLFNMMLGLIIIFIVTPLLSIFLTWKQIIDIFQ